MDFLINSTFPVLIGFIIGWGVGMTGIGAGVLVIPALVQILGIIPTYAVGTGLVFSVITRIGGSIYHLRLKTVRIRRSFYLLVGSIPGVLVSSTIVNSLVVRHGSEKVDLYLRITIGCILLLTAIGMLYQLFAQNQEDREFHISQSRVQSIPLSKKMLAVFFGLLIGVFIGTTSVGGGVIIIPIMVLFLDANGQQAVGTSIFISLFLAALGGVVYFLHGNVDIHTAVLLCLGALPGVWLGSQFSNKISERLLILIVVVMVVIGGVSLFF